METDELIIELNERIKELDSEILDFIDTHLEADNRNHIMKLINKTNEKIEKVNNRKKQLLEQSIDKTISNFKLR